MSRRVAAVLALAGSLASVGAPAAEVAVSPEARKHFQAGLAYINDPDGPRYEEAYHAFKAAYAASPSPKILGNLGQCAMKLERDSEAIESYSRYLKEVGDIDAAERQQIARDLEALQTSAARLKLSITPAGATVVDERTPVKGSVVTNRYGPIEGTLAIAIRAGRHRLVIDRDGHRRATIEIDAATGASIERTVALEPDRDTGSGVHYGVWIGVGLTAACAAGAGVTGGLALATGSSYRDINDGSDPGRAENLKQQGERLNIATDVLIGAGVASAAASTVMFFVLDAPTEQAATWRVVPLAARDRGGVLVGGAF